jgi:hypothetical protein
MLGNLEIGNWLASTIQQRVEMETVSHFDPYHA